jgi:hypothetical protein
MKVIKILITIVIIIISAYVHILLKESGIWKYILTGLVPLSIIGYIWKWHKD